MRVPVNIDNELLSDVRSEGLGSRRSLDELVDEGLRLLLARDDQDDDHERSDRGEIAEDAGRR